MYAGPEAPGLDGHLWNYLVSCGAIGPDTIKAKDGDRTLLTPAGASAISSGYSVGIVLRKALRMAKAEDDGFDIKRTNSAQDRVANWTWISENLPKLEHLGVSKFDATAKMLAVSGDLAVVASLLSSLKNATNHEGTPPRLQDAKYPQRRSHRPSSRPLSSLHSSAVGLRPVVTPMTAVRIDRLRQVLAQRLGLTLGSNPSLPTPDEVLPNADTWQQAPPSEGFVVLFRAMASGDEWLLSWMNGLLNQHMPGSDLRPLVAAVRLVKDRVTVQYLLQVFSAGLASPSAEITIAASRIICSICDHIDAQFLIPVYTWFFEPGSESGGGGGIDYIVQGVSRHSHLRTTLFRVLKAVAGANIVSALTEKLKRSFRDPAEYFAFTTEMVPLIGNMQSVDKQAINHILQFLLKEAMDEGSEKTVTSASVPAIQSLTALWTNHVSLIPPGPVADQALDAMRNVSKNGSTGSKMSSLACQFSLLHTLTKHKHKAASVVYKSLVFALIETHVGVVEGQPGDHMLHQFVQANLRIALTKLRSLPVQVMVEPLIKQHVSQGYNNLDLDFFHSISRHPKLGLRTALLLINFLAKVSVNDVAYGRMAKGILFDIVRRFHDQPPVVNYLVSYMKVVFSLFIKTTHKITQEEKGEVDPSLKRALTLDMMKAVWAKLGKVDDFKAQVSPMATSVISDFKEFFPGLEVPPILHRIANQKGGGAPTSAAAAAKAVEAEGQTGRSGRRGTPPRKPHTSQLHRKDRGSSHRKQQQLPSGDRNSAGHPKKKDKRDAHSRKGSHGAGGGGAEGGYGRRASHAADMERRARDKRHKIEARKRREAEKRQQLAEMDEMEKERQKEVQRAKIEEKTRRRIERLKRERKKKQANRNDELGSTPGGTPIVGNDEEAWSEADKLLWGKYKTQMKRIVRTYAGTRPDPVAKPTFSAISQALNTLSLAEFLKFWNDLKISPHHISRRVISQMYRTLGGIDSIFGAKQLCSGIRMLSTHQKLSSVVASHAKKENGEPPAKDGSDLSAEERALAMMTYLYETWRRCKYTPHNLWEPPKKKHSIGRKESSADGEAKKKIAEELTKMLEENPEAQIPEGFQKIAVQKVQKAWPEPVEAAQDALNMVLKAALGMSHDYGDPPETKYEAFEVVPTGGAASAKFEEDKFHTPTKAKYDPGRKRRELEEARKKREEDEAAEKVRKEKERKQRSKKLAVKLAAEKEKKREAERKKQEAIRKKEEEKEKKKQEELKRQAIERKKRKKKIEKYRKQKEEEERKKKERDEKLKKIKEEERRKQVEIYLKMKKEKEKVEAAKKKERDEILKKQKEEEERRRKDREKAEKAREDKRRHDAKVAVELRRQKKEEERAVALAAKKKAEEEQKVAEAAKEKRQKERLERRAKKLKKKMESAEHASPGKVADAEEDSADKKGKSPKKSPKAKGPGPEVLSDFAMTDDEKDVDKAVLEGVSPDGEKILGPGGAAENWKAEDASAKKKNEDSTETAKEKKEETEEARKEIEKETPKEKPKDNKAEKAPDDAGKLGVAVEAADETKE
mmetsp:Transcript_16737/g.33828  ORF Transcript_16737/g.33828 Transcript_16737/m.33828 type:complete len:1536 (+) Transcript_16737:85-4692(+)